jgi:hypothetical protein
MEVDAMSVEIVRSASERPTVLHVTHWKAGSQWIHKILNAWMPDRIVRPMHDMIQFLQAPVRPGMIYPTLYLTKEQFEKVALPPNSRRFVVVRDLRDSLVSWYFSVKISHPVDHPLIAEIRDVLIARDEEDGLIWAMDHPSFADLVAIQRSWNEAGESVIHYEDLFDGDESLLERVLVDEYVTPLERERLMSAIHANRFERLTGRARGTEDISSHERKGIAGDWRNHFTERVEQAFQQRYGGLLRATGYANYSARQPG